MKVYVSLTSIVDNQEILLKTLQSIQTQTVKPDQCFIYLSEEPYLLDKGFVERKMSPLLERFLKENTLFVVRWCPNLGPYRKLLPLLEEKWDEDCIIITIDDDTVYVPSLVKDYVDDYHQYHCCISYRGFTLKLVNSLKEISYEKRDSLKNNYLYNFHTGKGGVVYHPSFFRRTREILFNTQVYRQCCETGDDIWFNLLRMANGINCVVFNKPYQLFDLTNHNSLYTNFNMIECLNTINLQKTVNYLLNNRHMKDLTVVPHFDSNAYWETRYKNKGTSGDGSYGDKAQFKGNVINTFIQVNNIQSILDYGVGDGNQLKYINTIGRKYIGLDISPTAIKMCRNQYQKDISKQFYEFKDYRHQFKPDLVMSNDVIFHLIDDDIYYQYMKNLFSFGYRYIMIHAVDHDYVEVAHVKFRSFTQLIERLYPQWKIINIIYNPLWKGKAGKMGFYIYEKR